MKSTAQMQIPINHAISIGETKTVAVDAPGPMVSPTAVILAVFAPFVIAVGEGVVIAFSANIRFIRSIPVYKLKRDEIENGTSRRQTTTPHKTRKVFFGSLCSVSARIIATATISTDAERLICKISISTASFQIVDDLPQSFDFLIGQVFPV